MKINKFILGFIIGIPIGFILFRFIIHMVDVCSWFGIIGIVIGVILGIIAEKIRNS